MSTRGQGHPLTFGPGHLYFEDLKHFLKSRGWSGGAMVLGNLPVPRRPTNLD